MKEKIITLIAAAGAMLGATTSKSLPSSEDVR